MNTIWQNKGKSSYGQSGVSSRSYYGSERIGVTVIFCHGAH